MSAEGKECIFYQLTASGYRCVLMGPEEWRGASDRLLSYCKSGGSGCSKRRALEGKKMSNSCGFKKGAADELLH